MSILALFCVIVGAALVVGGLSWWRHERSRKLEEQRAVDEYLGNVKASLRVPRRAPHPQAQDETRQMPAMGRPVIRDALDHIHTPTPSPQPILRGTPMAIVTFSDGDDKPKIVDPDKLPPQLDGQEVRAAGPMGMGGISPDSISTSGNDFHTQREQDQAVAQLASQLADMDGAPWEVHELEQEEAPAPQSSQHWIGNYYDRRKSPFMNLANQLSKLSAPLATYLESAAVTVGGPGSVPVVKAGNRIVAGAKPEIRDKLNADVITITAQVRIRILAELNTFATTGVFPQQAAERFWVTEASNQLCIFSATKGEAQELADQLNASYRALTADAKSLVMKELAEVTDPSMGATLKAPSEERLPDFRKAAKSTTKVCGA